MIQKYEDYLCNENDSQDHRNYEEKYSYDSEDSAQFALKTEWRLFLRKYHPKLARSENIPVPIVTCPTFLGIFETYGVVDECVIVWGHEVAKTSFKQSSIEAEGKTTFSAKFEFPKNAKSIFLDFITSFYMKVCLGETNLTDEKMNEMKAKLENLIEKKMFGQLKY